MIRFVSDKLSDIRCDAIVIDIDCFGNLGRAAKQLDPAARAALKVSLDAVVLSGEIEPGRVVVIDSHSASDASFATTPTTKYLLLPLRVHSNGRARSEYVEACASDLIEQTLRLGFQTLAVGEMESQRGLSTIAIKKVLLQSMANVPGINLVQSIAEFDYKSVVIFTDGGAAPNPGRGGYGVVLRFGEHHKELSGGFSWTSNNRMELMAAIMGLEELKQPCHVRLYSDSRYLVDSVNDGLLFRRSAQNWEQSKYADLWRRFLKLYLCHKVELNWVKAHVGIKFNERCDQLATEAIARDNLPVDDGFALKQPANKKPPNDSSISKTLTQSNSMPSNSSLANLQRPRDIGDPCRHCGTKVIKQKTKKHKKGAQYHYKWYLHCSGCKRNYQVEAAKVKVEPEK